MAWWWTPHPHPASRPPFHASQTLGTRLQLLTKVNGLAGATANEMGMAYAKAYDQLLRKNLGRLLGG